MLTLLLLVYFMIEGISKVIFSADDTAFSELGLGLCQRGRWNTGSRVSLGQPSSNSDLAAWRTARHSAYLRRSRSRLFGVESARKLTQRNLAPRRVHNRSKVIE